MIMLNLLLTFILSLLTFSSEIKNTSWVNIDGGIYELRIYSDNYLLSLSIICSLKNLLVPKVDFTH